MVRWSGCGFRPPLIRIIHGNCVACSLEEDCYPFALNSVARFQWLESLSISIIIIAFQKKFSVFTVSPCLLNDWFEELSHQFKLNKLSPTIVTPFMANSIQWRLTSPPLSDVWFIVYDACEIIPHVTLMIVPRWINNLAEPFSNRLAHHASAIKRNAECNYKMQIGPLQLSTQHAGKCQAPWQGVCHAPQ